jgi:predicted  nucleic acid-binding Zn-ribbon protein
MAGPAVVLREIHRLQSFARDLQQRIDFAPKQLKAQQGAVTRQEETLHKAQDAIKKLKVAIHEKEVSIKAAQQHIKKYEQQLNDITSKKEYDALRTEIAGEQERIRQIEDETLNAMLEVEERTAQVPGHEEGLRKAKEEFAAVERDYQARLDDWKRQREEAVRQLAEVEASLPRDVKSHYDRLVRQLGADALAPVVNRTCSACNNEITAQMYNNLRTQQFVFCKSCPRLLYLKDESE